METLFSLILGKIGTVVLKAVLGHFILGGWRCADIFYGWVGVGGGIFWVVGDGWTFFMGGWGRVEVYSGWAGVGGHFLWVGGGMFRGDGSEWW